MLMGDSYALDLEGIVVGHLYYFFKVREMRLSGPRLAGMSNCATVWSESGLVVMHKYTPPRARRH